MHSHKERKKKVLSCFVPFAFFVAISFPRFCRSKMLWHNPLVHSQNGNMLSAQRQKANPCERPIGLPCVKLEDS